MSRELTFLERFQSLQILVKTCSKVQVPPHTLSSCYVPGIETFCWKTVKNKAGIRREMPGLALRMLRANKILRITKYLIKGGFSSQGDADGES